MSVYPLDEPQTLIGNSPTGAISSGVTQSSFVPEMITNAAALQPHALAVRSSASHLTYAELDRRASQVASYLRSLGVGAETIVGIYLKRSIEMVVAALGIMRAGAAYLPLNPDDPDERVAFMIADAKCPVLVTAGCGVGKFHVGATVDLDHAASLIAGQPIDPSRHVLADQLAYVIYTSGSTGTPKGVAVTHASLANLVTWHRDAFQVTPSDRASHLAGLNFDAAVWELWPYLAAGASIHLIADEARLDAESLRDALVQDQITIGFAPTPMAERLLTLSWPAQCTLRLLLTGGDTLHRHPPATLPFALVNNYGPTECTVVATSGPVPVRSDNSLPSIGSPISNVCLHILDEHMHQVPDGTVGELYIGGAGVARGYVNEPTLTEERFLPDPFHAHGRMYRSGDLVRRLPNGEIAFLGRKDQQVKVRGYRIELDEIVFALNSHPAVSASAVAVADHEGDKRLVGYVIPNSVETPTRTEIQEYLRRKLPDYMVPAVFVVMPSLPIMNSGKVDRAALPHPTAENIMTDGQAEEKLTAIEQRITAIVAELLGIKEVHKDENFFMLGGHSLMGTQLISRLRGAFGVDIPLRTLFEKASIRELAQETERLLQRKTQAVA